MNQTVDTLIWTTANKRCQAPYPGSSHDALYQMEMSLQRNTVSQTRALVEHELHLVRQCKCVEYCQAKIKEYEWFLEVSIG